MTQAQENPVFTEPLLPTQHDAVAPDGSLVRVLARLPSGSMAHFELGAGEVPAHNGTGPSARSGTSPGSGTDVAPPERTRGSGDRS
jgi:hypothetical protein